MTEQLDNSLIIMTLANIYQMHMTFQTYSKCSNFTQSSQNIYGNALLYCLCFIDEKEGRSKIKQIESGRTDVKNPLM